MFVIDRFDRVHALARTGFNDYEISRLTGVPRSTVQRWRNRKKPPLPVAGTVIAGEWQVADPARYCYLLGAYLGDGHLIHSSANCWVLRIASDRQYETIEEEVMRAMEVTFPGRKAKRFQASSPGANVLQISHPAVGRAFPQHGAGRKHLRQIVLADWQSELTHAHPGALIRGLIHSDGCRALNSFRTKLPSGRMAEYSYVRYFFSNLSADIRAIFIEHCQLLGVHVTQSNHRNLSISHRASVAVLEDVVGVKR